MKPLPSLLTRAGIAALALVALGASAKADEIYSTFGSGIGYISNVGRAIDGHVNNTYSYAGKFSVTQNYALTGFEVAAGHSSGLNSYLFSIVSDNGGVPTGSNIFSTSGALGSGFPTTTTTSLAATGSLLAGNTYWLVVKAGASNTFGGWNSTNGTATGILAQINGGAWGSTPNNTASAFRINGTLSAPTSLTPEVPAGVQAVPVLLAVAGMALYQRRKQKASTL